MKLSLLTIVICIICSGCIELEQEIWIRKNGTARLKVEFGIAQHVYNIALKKNPDEIKKLQQAKESLEKHPAIQEVKFSKQMKGDFHYIVYDIEIKNYKKLSHIHGIIFRDPPQQPGKPITQQRLAISKLKQGKISFLYTIERKGDKPQNNFATGLLNKVFANRYSVIKLHTPKVISTNGNQSGAQDIEWKIPMSQLMAPTALHKKLQADIQMPRKGWIFLVLAALIIAIVFFVRKMKS